MKKTIFLAALLCSIICHAQLIPNGSFENWTPIPGHPNVMEPDGWGTPNNTCIDSGYTPVVQRTTDAHSGSYALKLFPFKRQHYIEAVSSVGVGKVKPGYYLINLHHFYWNIPATYVPASITGYYKTHKIDSNMEAVTIEAVFYKKGIPLPDTAIAHNGIYLPPQDSFTRFELPLKFNWGMESYHVDSMSLIINFYSRNEDSVPVQYAIFDDISVEGRLSLNDVALSSYLTLSPVPAYDRLVIKQVKPLALKAYGILSLTGQILQSAPWRQSDEIDISSLPPGSYVLQLVTEKGIGSMKFLKE